MMDTMTIDYFDYDDPGDFDSYPSVYGFVGPDNYELHHDLHGPHDCRVYCVSRGDIGVVPYWSRDEEGDVYEGDVAMHRTGSNETVNSVVSTIRPGGPGDETGSVADAPGDAIVMFSECQDIERGTLDNIRMWQVNPQSESKV